MDHQYIFLTSLLFFVIIFNAFGRGNAFIQYYKQPKYFIPFGIPAHFITQQQQQQQQQEQQPHQNYQQQEAYFLQQQPQEHQNQNAPFTRPRDIIASGRGNAFIQYYKKPKYFFPFGIPAHFIIQQQQQQQLQQQQQQQKHQDQNAQFTSPFSALVEESDPALEKQSVEDLQEGSPCRRSFDGQDGHCVLATQCLHVVRQFRKFGRKIDICTYRKNVAVICCPPLTEKREVKQVKKRVSVQKCEEFLDFRATFRYKRNASDPIPKCVPSNPLIVGGESTYPGEYPHMAAIGWSRNRLEIKWACGGSLINEFYVLTAAHCTQLDGLPPDVVSLGRNNIIDSNEKGDPQDIRVANVIRNPNYKMSNYYHDIALLKLTKKPRFSRFVRPACLWQFPDINAEYGIATGWGKIKYDGERSDKLLKVDLKLAGNNLCNSLYKNITKLPRGIIDEQFCAGHLEGGKDTCLGDSGGPIHISVPEGKCINYIIGVTSFGKFCALPKSLGVYTKVYSYLDWIEEIAFESK